MKNYINKSVLEALKVKFGNLFATEILQEVAEDRSKDIADDVAKLIEQRAAKGVSKSFIIKKYLVDDTAKKKKSDSTNKAKTASDTEQKAVPTSPQSDANIELKAATTPDQTDVDKVLEELSSIDLDDTQTIDELTSNSPSNDADLSCDESNLTGGLADAN